MEGCICFRPSLCNKSLAAQSDQAWLFRSNGLVARTASNAHSCFCCTLREDTWSLALGLRVVKLGVSAVLVQEVPVKLSPAYMMTVRPAGTLTEDAQSLRLPVLPAGPWCSCRWAMLADRPAIIHILVK